MSKISVIIPVYNVEEYLEECIDSVLNQTFKDVEIILIDDGSTDGSGRICDKFASDYSQFITVIHKKHQGPFISRLIGIKNAHSDIIVFLDSDDTLKENALEIISHSFFKYKCDMVMFDSGVCENYQYRIIEHPLTDETIFWGELKNILFEKILTNQVPNSICLKAAKRNKLLSEEYSDECLYLKHGEDLIMSAYLIGRCERIAYIKQGLYNYRMRVGSITHTFDFQRKEAIKIVHTELTKCIDLWGMPELKRLHNTRKVKGWIENLLLLIKNKHNLDNNQFCNQLKSMGEDSYFLTAYNNMECSKLPRLHRIFAYFLFKKQYFVLHGFSYAYQLVQKIKQRRFNAK